MPRTDVPLYAGEQVTRSGLGEMAAEAKGQHVLKCFQRNNLMALLAHIIEAALGMGRVTDLCPARQEYPPPRLMKEVMAAMRPGIPVEFVCTGPFGPRA